MMSLATGALVLGVAFILLSIALALLLVAYLLVALFRSSRGEKAEVDELMVIAEAIADNEDNEHWRQWEDELKEAGR